MEGWIESNPLVSNVLIEYRTPTDLVIVQIVQRKVASLKKSNTFEIRKIEHLSMKKKKHGYINPTWDVSMEAKLVSGWMESYSGGYRAAFLDERHQKFSSDQFYEIHDMTLGILDKI